MSGISPNSMLHWFPPIEAAGLPVPKTWTIPILDLSGLYRAFDGKPSAEFDRLIAEVGAVLYRQHPLFIRTDQTSAKHSGPGVYRIDAADSATPSLTAGRIGQHLYDIIEDHEMKWGVPQPRAIILREWLDLDSTFTAFGGHAINREFRFFATRRQCLCWHPYWPADAIEDHVDEEKYPDWRERLADLQTLSTEDLRILTCHAMQAVKAVSTDDEPWSVDFAMDRHGDWYLIDMAEGAKSFHWPGCAEAMSSAKVKMAIARERDD